MEVRPGYKQTGAGVIPEAWDVRALKELAVTITDGDHATPTRTSSGYYLLSARNVLNGRIDVSDVDYVGVDEYTRALAERAKTEKESAHVRRRLYPELPADMPYVTFYPMSKRRDAVQNWYTLTLDERSRLMQAHGLTGRRYAGKVQQVITGAIGLDKWEWGVTLFGRDPLEFKKLVTDMRFDEVSANYAEFGDFYVGRIISG